MWTVLGKLLVGAVGFTALVALIGWIVEEGFTAAGDASAIGGPPQWWHGLGYFAMVVGAIVLLVKG